MAYRLLRKRQTWFAGNRYGAFHRSALLFGVPVGIALATVFFLTGYNDKPTALAVAGILSTSLCITAALHDRETHIDPVMARIWFIACIAFILVFLTLCVAAMLVMYLVEQAPSTGNFFWSWKFAWSDLGYPAEEFSQRQRNGLLAFTLAGSCYMTVAIGGSLLGAILKWARPGSQVALSPEAAGEAPQEIEQPLGDWVKEAQAASQDSPEFVLAMNGQESTISRSRYENLLADKDRLLSGCRLLVDKASGTAFARTAGRWRKLPFRGTAQGTVPPPLRLCAASRQALHHR